MAKALITGGSNGIGLEIARELSKRGYEVCIVSRNEEKLRKASEDINNCSYIAMDISSAKSCIELYKRVRDIDVLVNNAGFGAWGEFTGTDLKNELNMIDLNIKALHILTKLYLRDFIKKDKGHILNVASLAAFGSGPLMAAYYGTKAYVYKLSTAINEELRIRKSNVKISVLCPGPVDTGFNARAGVKFSIKSLTDKYVAEYAVDKLFKGRMTIIPGRLSRISALLSRIAPERLMLRVCYMVQRNKGRKLLL